MLTNDVQLKVMIERLALVEITPDSRSSSFSDHISCSARSRPLPRDGQDPITLSPPMIPGLP
jgi:hypothetical protein